MVQIKDEAKEAAILEAARKLFLHYGFKKTSVDDISREAGVAKGTVYLYFKNKQEILGRLGVDYLNQSKDQLVERLSREADPREKLRMVLRLRAQEIYNFVSLHPHAIDLILNLSREEGERLGAGQFYREYMELIKAVIEEGQRAGVFRPVNGLDEFVYHICFMTQAFQPPYKLVSNLDDLLPHVDAYAATLVASLAIQAN